MIDRELLELAAKAAGLYTVGPYESALAGFMGLCIRPDDNPSGYCWNPLDDDGDALRLAVKIGMEFAADDEATHCAFAYARVRGAGDSHIFEPVVDDPCKAMRRAIVRAAAEIGREMQHE